MLEKITPASLVIILALSATPVFAATHDFFIPKWFYNVYQFFKDGQISEQEFEEAVAYLQKINVIKIKDDPQRDTLTDFVITSMIIEQNLDDAGFSYCTNGWYITGYFTPIESDYSGDGVAVTIDEIPHEFKSDFVDEVKVEGWGRTLGGSYLGWYDDSFHTSGSPLDGVGNRLDIGSVAVDPSIIYQNAHLVIPTLPFPWDHQVFVASDTGPAIMGKHIDVYTGEGKGALDEAYRITGDNNRVCLEKK